MKKALRRTLKISGIILGALAGLLVAALLLVIFDKPLVRNFIQGRLARGEGATARIGRLDYTLFPLRVTVESLEFGREDAFEKMDVSVGRLEAAGSLWKLLRGVKPALDGIEADGLSFRLEQKAVSSEPLDIEALLLQAADALAWTKRAAVTNTRLSISLLEQGVEIGGLDLSLSPDPATDIVAYDIGRGDLSLTDKGGSLVLASGLSSSGRFGLVSPFIVDASFALSSPKFALGGLEDSLDGADVALTGRLDTSSQEMSVSRLRIGVPGLLDLEGKAVGSLGHGLFLESEARVRFESVEAAAALLGPLLPGELRAASPRGRAELAGTYALQRSDQGLKDNLSASLSLDGIVLSPAVAGRPVRIRAGGRIDAAGSTEDPRFEADIRASLGAVAVAGLSVSSSDIRLVASGTRSSADISLLDARLAGLAFEAAEEKTIAFDKAALIAKGTIDLARESGILTSLEARLPDLAPLRFSGRFGSGRGASSELRLDAQGLDVPALRAKAAPFLPAGFGDWDIGGALDLSLSVRRPTASPGDWHFSGAVSFADAMFNDPSFSIAGEGLDPVLEFEGTGSPATDFSFSGSLDVGRGESLWKSVYISWSEHPLKLTASGRYDPGSDAIDGLVAHVLLPEVGVIDVTGQAGFGAAPTFDLATEARLSLGPLYSLYTEAGVSEEARMRIEGALEAALRVRKAGEALSAGGRVKLSDTNIERPQSETFVLGVTADLPLLYESGPALPETSEGALPEEGKIRIREFQNPYLTLKSMAFAVRAGVNALAFEPVSLELYGGRLELGRTTFRFDPAAGTFRGVGSLALRDIDISRFPIQSPKFHLTGRIQADFPRLVFGPDRIAVSGRGEASVFGGTVVLRDLGVSDPFAPGRSISLNVDLVELDLKKLTDEVPFGEVTGIVSGEVRDLVITYRQPESFFFRVESVPRKGVPQTFSLKAVDDLTVLSSGQQASAGTGGFWMRFIRGFRYEKLGIVSTLHNDTFTLNGIIHEGATEYLVKKPALFGISVVNREPGKSISFKEMTSRLKRVGQSER
jgi:hypothetical protein